MKWGFIFGILFFISLGLSTLSHEHECSERDGFYAKYQTCNSACNDDEDCDVEDEVCRCEGRCGLSCIKIDDTIGCYSPNQPNPPHTGTTAMSPVPESLPVAFGHGATVKCWSGRLIGDSTISCMANGQWSSDEFYCLQDTNDKVKDARRVTCSVGDLVTVPHSVSNTDGVSIPYNPGETVTYICQQGYEKLGREDYVICLNNGSWSYIGMECIPITCGNTEIPEHAIISTYVFTVGSTVTFTCQEGYELEGNRSRTCRIDDELSIVYWNNSAPFCQPMSCDPLNVDSPLEVSVDEYLIGTVATFACDDGYRLEGETSITCLTSQQWSNNVPTCREITCTIPQHSSDTVTLKSDGRTIIQPGRQVALDEEIIYECVDDEKRLHGDETRACLEDSTFSGTEPSCHNQCPEQPHLANSHTLCSYYPNNIPSRLHGSVLLFYCQEHGYFLEGVSRFECVDGRWEPFSPDALLDADHPKCIAVPAQEAKFFSYSIRSPLHYLVGEDFEYQLMVVEGSTIYIDCRRHTTATSWNPLWVYESEDPDISAVVLSTQTRGVNYFQLGGRDNGWYRLFLFDVTTERTGKYSCVNIGSGERSSSINLHIGNSECMDPGTPENGARSQTEMPTHAPYRFTFSCNSGYIMIGSARTQCSKSIDYEWTYPVPVCEKIIKTCQNQIYSNWDGANGFSEITYVTNDEVDEAIHSFYCDIGYELRPVDANNATCRNESNPQWSLESDSGSSSDVSCDEKAVKVEIVPSPTANRRYSFYADTYNGISCRLEDNQAPRQIGWKVKISSGEFADVSSIPTSHVCALSNDTGAWLVINGAKESESGEYACVYSSTDDAASEDMEVIWITILTTCSDATELDFPNGQISSPPNEKSYMPEDSVVFSCDEGYALFGETDWLCGLDGNWDSNDRHVCIPDYTFSLNLGKRLLVSHTSLTINGGADVIIDCKTEGYIRDIDPRGDYGFGWFKIDNGGGRQNDHFEQFVTQNGSNLRMFLSQISTEQGGTYACGTYTSVTSVILDIVLPCPPLLDPTYGSLQGWSSRTDTVVTYKCADRYEVTGGDLTRTCLKSGIWTGTEPVCSLAECPSLTAPTNGQFADRTVSFRLHEEVTFTCADGYTFVDDVSSSLLCQDDGSWNETAPTCISKCSNVECNAGEKCVINPEHKEAECICKDITEDCIIGTQPVCGSDALTYPSQCVLEVTACVDNVILRKVADGPCKNCGLCSSQPVPSSSNNCDPLNVYYYSAVLMKCTDTSGGSCMAEDTGFPTREACDASCTEANFCNIAKDPGPCNQAHTRWAWDSASSNSASHTCVEFTYGGCQGNENNFRSRDECLLTCPDRCKTCPETMSLYNACDYGQYAIRANLLRLSRFEKTPSRTYPTTFHMRINQVLKTNPDVMTPAPDPNSEYNLWSTVLYRGVTCPCPKFLTLDSAYLIVTKLENGLSRNYGKEPIVTEGTFVKLWSDDVECELRCTETCNDLYESLGLPDCPHPGNAKCDCCN